MSIRNLRWAGLFALALVIALAVGGTLVARGAPGGQDDPPPPIPHIFDTIPLPGEELALDGAVSFFFDVPMDTSTVESAFGIAPAVPGDLAWTNDDRTLIFTPSEKFERATEYTFGFNTSALSTEGVALEEAFTLRLTTLGYLEVSEVLPGDGTTAVDTDTVFTVIFNRPVVPVVMVDDMDTLPQPLTFDPALEGTGEWLNTSIYMFTPTAELRGGTEYTATIVGGLEDVTGSVLKADYEWTFSTLAPDVLEISPGAGWDRISLDRTIRVEFTQAMDPETTEAAFSLVYQEPLDYDPEVDPAPVPEIVSGTFEWNESFRAVTFTPDEQLRLESWYGLIVDEEIARSATGAALREGVRGGFSTVPYPEIVSTRPVDGDGFASPYGGFTIYFNTNMDLDTLKDKVIIEPEPWREFDDYYYDYRDSYNLAFDVEPSTDYTITILPGMADEYGNTIDVGMTVTFTTDAYPPELTIQATGSVGMYSAHNDETRVFATHRNVDRIDLALWEMTTAQLAEITGADSYSAWRNFVPANNSLLRQWSIDVTAAQDLRRYELLLIADTGPSGISNVQCLAAPDPRVRVGDVVIVTREDTTPLNIRQEPNLGGQPITQVLPDETMQVVGGPYCADGYLWWEMRLDNDITGWAAEGTLDVYFYEPLGAVPLDPNAPHPDVFGAPYSPDALDPGVYYLEVTSPETDGYDHRPRRHVLLVQSANITLKFSQDTALAWVTDLDTGQPLADVPVIFYNEEFNPVGTADTDADGLAVIETPHLADLYTSVAATVNYNEWFGYAASRWNDGMDPWQFDIRSDYEPEDFTVYLYTDRPIYRPGQPVYFKGILRDRFDIQYTVPDIATVPVRVYDDRGEIIYETDLPVTPGGSFSGEVMLADDAPLGYYRVVAGIESNKRSSFGVNFNVAEYRAPEFQVDVLPEVNEVAQGDTIRVLVDSSYFFGGAVSNASVSYTVLANDYRFRYTGNEPGYFSFVDNNYDFYAPEYYGPYGGPVAVGEGLTDAQGRFWIELDADLGDEPESKTWTIEARVVDESDQLVAGRASVTVHQGLEYVGLQPEEYFGRA
ncbi:MAG: Ig-like domain-containing protein [Anaerolineae bacterium]|nr:Ig-like domain-containing protein [Anaerolineae bacterium]